MNRLDDILKQHFPEPPGSNGAPDHPDEPSLPDDKGWLCPICGGTGYLRQDVPVNHPDFGKLVKCDCRQRELEEQRLQNLRSISNMQTMTRFTFERFLPDGFGLTEKRRHNLRTAYDTAYEFAQKPEGWLILLGGYGCGKTHLAAAIANYVISQGKPATFVVVPDLLDHLRSTYGPNTPVSYDRRFEEVRSAPLLILDDLGSHSSTQW